MSEQAMLHHIEVSGHGGDYVRDQRLLTLADAISEAEHWERYADTIGGRARVVNAATGDIEWGGHRPTPDGA